MFHARVRARRLKSPTRVPSIDDTPRYFSLVCNATSCGRAGAGGCLFQRFLRGNPLHTACRTNSALCRLVGVGRPEARGIRVSTSSARVIPERSCQIQTWCRRSECRAAVRIRGFLVHAQREVAELVAELRLNQLAHLLERNIDMCPVAAFVAGVKMGSGS